MHFQIKPCVISIIAFLFFIFPASAFAEMPAAADADAVRYEITIYKSDKKLVVFLDGRSIRTFRIAALGSSPLGPKTRRGDNKTPEGEYHVILKSSTNLCHPSLELDFPNADDAHRAFDHHRITVDQDLEIIWAMLTHSMPPQDTPLGGAIFIHRLSCMRHPEATYGCIALYDADDEELFYMIPAGTRVDILP